MRQAGIVAAGALYALDHNVDRLADDHANARDARPAARGDRRRDDRPRRDRDQHRDLRGRRSRRGLCAGSKRDGVRMGVVGPRRVRAVTHLDVDADGIQRARRGRPELLALMKLEGLHHITAITGDAPRNVDFYVRVLGLRLVKKSVNQDDPTVYHLFYADERGSAGSDLTFFEYPNARPGQGGRGHGPPDRAPRRSADTLDFWADRLGYEGVATSRGRRRAALRRPGRARARAGRGRRPRRAAARPLDRGAGRARAAGLPRRLRGASPTCAAPRRC